MGGKKSDTNVTVICSQIGWTASWLIKKESFTVCKQHSLIYLEKVWNDALMRF